MHLSFITLSLSLTQTHTHTQEYCGVSDLTGRRNLFFFTEIKNDEEEKSRETGVKPRFNQEVDNREDGGDRRTAAICLVSDLSIASCSFSRIITHELTNNYHVHNRLTADYSLLPFIGHFKSVINNVYYPNKTLCTETTRTIIITVVVIT